MKSQGTGGTEARGQSQEVPEFGSHQAPEPLAGGGNPRVCGHQARTRAASVGLWTPGSKQRADSPWTTHNPHGPQGSEKIIPETPQGPHSHPTGTPQNHHTDPTGTPKHPTKPSDAPRGVSTSLAVPRRPWSGSQSAQKPAWFHHVHAIQRKLGGPQTGLSWARPLRDWRPNQSPPSPPTMRGTARGPGGPWVSHWPPGPHHLNRGWERTSPLLTSVPTDPQREGRGWEQLSP